MTALSAGLDPDFEWFAAEPPVNPQVRDSATLWIMDETGSLAFPRITFDAIGECWAEPFVQLNFVDQTGNPNNKDGGVSRHPDLAPEFTFRMKQPQSAAVVSRSSDAISGFVGATPFAAASDIELQRNPQAGRLAWGAYCPGVAGMGRQAAETTANSEIFFMREASRRLDRDYTVWGTVVQGLDVVRAMTVGEPPANPDKMIKVRLAADLPPAERPRIEVLDEHSAAFTTLVEQVRAAKGADFTVCDIQVPTRPAP